MTAVLGLIQELADFEKEPDAVLITVDEFAMALGCPLFHVFVAEVASEIIGALYYYRYSTWKVRRYI
jgi:hypothetical protein